MTAPTTTTNTTTTGGITQRSPEQITPNNEKSGNNTPFTTSSATVVFREKEEQQPQQNAPQNPPAYTYSSMTKLGFGAALTGVTLCLTAAITSTNGVEAANMAVGSISSAQLAFIIGGVLIVGGAIAMLFGDSGNKNGYQEVPGKEGVDPDNDHYLQPTGL